MTPDRIEAVRRVMPHADDLTIRRHLEQRDALVRQMEQQRRERDDGGPDLRHRPGDVAGEGARGGRQGGA